MVLVVLLAFWHSLSHLLVQCTDPLLRSSQMAADSSELFLCQEQAWLPFVHTQLSVSPCNCVYLHAVLFPSCTLL